MSSKQTKSSNKDTEYTIVSKSYSSVASPSRRDENESSSIQENLQRMLLSCNNKEILSDVARLLTIAQSDERNKKKIYLDSLNRKSINDIITKAKMLEALAKISHTASENYMKEAEAFIKKCEKINENPIDEAKSSIPCLSFHPTVRHMNGDVRYALIQYFNERDRCVKSEPLSLYEPNEDGEIRYKNLCKFNKNCAKKDTCHFLHRDSYIVCVNWLNMDCSGNCGFLHSIGLTSNGKFVLYGGSVVFKMIIVDGKERFECEHQDNIHAHGSQSFPPQIQYSNDSQSEKNTSMQKYASTPKYAPFKHYKK
jgi:hypothetical protein